MIGKIEYEDSTYKTLGLALSTKDLDVTDLSIIESRTFGNVEFGVLGASHYVKIRAFDKVFTEVFACRKLEGDINYYPLIGGDFLFGSNDLTEGLIEDDVFTYGVRINIETDIDVINHVISNFEDMASFDDETIGIKFPTPEGVDVADLPFEPATYITLVRELNRTLVTTIHTYPEEGVMVFTASKIEKK